MCLGSSLGRHELIHEMLGRDKAQIEELWELYHSARDGGHVVDAPWGFAEPKRHVVDKESLSRADTIKACSRLDPPAHLPADVGNAPEEDAGGSPPDDAAGKEGGGEGVGGGKTKAFKGLRRKLSTLCNAFSSCGSPLR